MQGSRLGTPGHSLALQYEVDLLQQVGGGAPTTVRVNKCFQIMEEVIPKLGVFQRVMQILKQELYVAVFSNNHTSKSSTSQQSDPLVDQRSKIASTTAPLPYFVLAQRLGERKSSERSKVKAEISSLKEQLYTCEADLEKAVSSLESYRHDLKEREAKIHHLMAELRHCYAENQHLQELVGHHQHAKDRISQELDFRVFSLRNTIASLKEDNGKLKEYKCTYDQLQQTQLLTKYDPEHAPAQCNNEIEQHKTTIKDMKFQLLTLQNYLLDELDSWLKSCYSAGSQVSHEDMVHMKKTFKKKISSVSAELSLLDRHDKALRERVSQLNIISKSSSSHSALVLPLHPLNPLIPQEQTCNKFSAMIFTSSGGTIFYPLKVAQHCTSCGQKTVLCPHKIFTDDLVLELPLNSTHLKLSRPSLQLIKPQLNCAGENPQVSEQVAHIAATTQGLHATAPDFNFLWTQYNKKFLQSDLPLLRKISQDQLLDLVEEFYAYLLLKDDEAVVTSDDGDELPTVCESLFEFLRGHYLMRLLTPGACHTFISSLQKFYRNSKELVMLSHVLCGDLDACSIRYSLVQASLVQAIPQWISQAQFSAFITSLYPFLADEDKEQLCLNYTSHSDNQLSSELVLNFLQDLILSHKDPLVAMLEAQFTEQSTRIVGFMLEAEFAEVMERAVPESSDLLSHKLFLQSLAMFKEKSEPGKHSLPVRSLAYIAAYLYRLSMESKLVVKFNALEAGSSDAGPSRGGNQTQKQQQRGEGHKVHTLETARKLAERIKELQETVLLCMSNLFMESEESDNEEERSDDTSEIEWYTLPELAPSTDSTAPNSSEVDTTTELDMLWLRFLSSPLSSSGAEEDCTCRRVSKPPEHKAKEPPERTLMFKPFGEQRNGLTLSEAFAAQHPKLLRRSRIMSARKEHMKSCKAEIPKPPKLKFPEDKQKLMGQERNSRIKMYQKEVLDQIRDHESSRYRSSSKHSPTRPWK